MKRERNSNIIQTRLGDVALKKVKKAAKKKDVTLSEFLRVSSTERAESILDGKDEG